MRGPPALHNSKQVLPNLHTLEFEAALILLQKSKINRGDSHEKLLRLRVSPSAFNTRGLVLSDLYDIAVDRIDGTSARLSDYAGKVLLIVNVASKCGLTPQYDGLENLYRTYRDQGLVVLGFPANNFAGQEPGSNQEVAEFCRSPYGVDFPMFSKLSVKGEDQHPLYRLLVEGRPDVEFKPDSGFLKRRTAQPSAAADHDVVWNFEKFLVDREGTVIGRFAPDTPPEDPAITEAIVGALKR